MHTMRGLAYVARDIADLVRGSTPNDRSHDMPYRADRMAETVIADESARRRTPAGYIIRVKLVLGRNPTEVVCQRLRSQSALEVCSGEIIPRVLPRCRGSSSARRPIEE